MGKCHFYHLGLGGNRRKDMGRGCNCPENIIYLTPKEHDELDRRRINKEIEEEPIHIPDNDLPLTKADIHKWKFARYYRLEREFLTARKHYYARLKGQTKCAELK